MKLLPKPKPTDTPPVSWQGLADLRISLVSQGRFIEALRFSTVERNRGTTMQRYQTTTLLLQLAMKHRAEVTDPKDEITWRAAMLQLELDLGSLFTSLRANAEAEIWFSTLETELNETINLVNSSTESLKVADCLDTLTIEYYRLQMLENEDPTEDRFQQALVLGEKMLAASHMTTERCHYLAIAWAKKLYPDNPSICIDIQFRTQHLFENIQRRIPSAVMNLIDILSPRANNVSEVAKSIEMIESFERKYPNITMPLARRGFQRLRNGLYILAGRGNELGTAAPGPMEISWPLPMDYSDRREPSNFEANEETLKFKDIMEKKTLDHYQSNLIARFFVQPPELTCPKLFKDLLAGESASGVLSKKAMGQLFGIEETVSSQIREELLKLEGAELLERLIGTVESPLYGVTWKPRRLALRDWLLDLSRPQLPIRQCLWIFIHNARMRCWREHCTKGIWQNSTKAWDCEAENTNTAEGKAAALASLASDPVPEKTLELIDAIEERAGLDEAKLGYALNHFEGQTRMARSSLPILYTSLFSYSLRVLREPSEACAGYLNRAEEIARDQLEHWRSVNNYEFIARDAVAIATIHQYRIEYRIIKHSVSINRTLEEALGLLEEVEMLFGTTLHEVDLSQSLATLTMKVHMGNKMGIWTVGHVATRLLLHATRMTPEETQGNESQEDKADRDKRVMKLWQWVQRVKARSLAQSMGLDNAVPVNMLVEIQNSINDDAALAEKEIGNLSGSADSNDQQYFTQRLEAVKLGAGSQLPLELLPEVRHFLEESNAAVPKLDIKHAARKTSLDFKEPLRESISCKLEDVFSVSEDLQRANMISEKLKRTEKENATTLEEELESIVERISTKPAQHRLLILADLLNREEALLRSIDQVDYELPSERYEKRVKLQRLRQEMRHDPLLQHMLRIREGRPLSNKDLHAISADRNRKAVFVDWFSVKIPFSNDEKLYMLVWRNGICKLIDLNTRKKNIRRVISEFFNDKDVHLPDVVRTASQKDMDLENPVPITIPTDELVPVLDCLELVQPLFDDPMIEDEDLMVFSVTEGFENFPLHAIEDDDKGPLILHHPVVYVPSLSVLHKCYWARHASNKVPPSNVDESRQSLILGGIESTDPAFQYGTKAVKKIGTLVNSPNTFVGDEATLHNFRAKFSNANLIHIHLHTNYGMDKKSSEGNDTSGKLGETSKEDTAFTTSPLDQALLFNSADGSHNQLTARQIIEIKPAKGAHLNLIACASGRQGKFSKSDKFEALENMVTDEVMGLVPAFLFSGVGSVTSTLWAIQDEHGAVFSHVFFRELMRAKETSRYEGKETGLSVLGCKDSTSLIDLAEVQRKAVLEMRMIYKQPSAWAGFILSGFWNAEI
jgi:CHAT domain-containing protein